MATKRAFLATVVLVVTFGVAVGWRWGGGGVGVAPARAADAEPGLSEPAAPSRPKPADTDEQLARVIPVVDFQNVPLEVAFDRLRDAAQANIVVQWRALEATGVRRDDRVRLRLWDVPLGRALGVLLAAASDDSIEFGYVGEDGVITVTTKDRLHGYLPTKAYDIRDLVRQMEKSDAELRGTVAEGEYAGMTIDEYVDEVSTYLRDMIDPDSWRDNGGSVGAIRHMSGRLLVTQTPTNHRRLQQALEDLRTEFRRPMRPSTATTRPTLRQGE